MEQIHINIVNSYISKIFLRILTSIDEGLYICNIWHYVPSWYVHPRNEAIYSVLDLSYPQIDPIGGYCLKAYNQAIITSTVGH